jgi:hypothetical protein
MGFPSFSSPPPAAPHPPQRQRRRSRSVGGGAAPFLNAQAYGLALVILRIALLVGALTLAYLLWGLFSPQIAHFNGLPRADRSRVMENIALARQALAWSCLIAAVTAAVAFFRDEVCGYVLALSGAALHVGIPFLITFFADATNFSQNKAQSALLTAISSAGFVPLLLGGGLIALDVTRRLLDLARNRPLSRDLLRYGSEASAEGAARPLRLALLGKCWEGQYCREFVRVHCPIFHKRKACWRVKKGCYCEDDIVSTAALRMSGTQLRMAPDPRYNFANAPTPPAGRKAELTPAQKRERCRHCVIYLDHQRQKYALLMPVLIVGVCAAAIVFSPLVRDLLRVGLSGVETVMARFSWGDAGSGISFRLGRPSPTVEWLLIGALALMALSKALEALEWALFKLKI